ncbi:Isoquinoline 1-oxidoreductase subunit beta [Rubripirellula tenax]|uniref:Isoquinoline 1-oxidoreductase subunit beta n=1 Tax=Rubripirellula tenax TaxID=2528015 RepID=A0A5C6F8I2_9BACT|nr:molybdopterin cofactor-binding domain-containing protein [Rubripirellula tenax]TWU56794.1 Isoquinoline 1-oxidoreductase subunit beta [Rubripirellula tenax]
MNQSTKTESQLNRRSFIAGVTAGSLVLMAKLNGQEVTVADASKVNANDFAPDLFVSIAPDGLVSILSHRSEMGTGIRTSLPRIVADELEADWDRVKIVQAIGDKRLGDQNTDGSNSVRFFYDRMRVAGATARTMLERAAAQAWSVDAANCKANNHRVDEIDGNRSIGFGDLVAIARTLDVPSADELTMKTPDQWRYIGKDAPITDMDAILTGKAVFGIDARMDNQLFAVIARPPVVGGQVKSFDAADTRKMAGVIDVIEIPKFQGAPLFQPLGGVAVCATSTWAAWQGRDSLTIDWDHGPNQDYNTDDYAKTLSQSANQPGKAVREHGDALKEIQQSPNVFNADYSVPHLAHAPMETPCAVANVKTDGDKVIACEITAATQNPQAVQQAVGLAMGVPHDSVIVNVTLLGSGFGRKSKPDYCVEAAMLSRHVGRPVHVTWTREDDIQHDYLHAISHVHVEAAVDDQGNPTAWLSRAAYPSIGSTFNADAVEPADFEYEMGLTDLPFDIPNLRVEVGQANAHTRIGWLRSVCHIQQVFAMSSFADELAQHAKRDPYEYLLGLLGEDRHIDLEAAGLANRGASGEDFPYDIGRLKEVVRRVAKQSDWQRHKDLPRGRGLGIACCRSFLGYTGHVVEVDITQDGKLSIPKVWVSMDAGLIVSPDRVRAQIEGAAIMATSQARYGKITFKQGRIQQSNYDTFRVATMRNAPREINIDLVDSMAPPAGVGETTVASFAPALCNAVFAATGKRIRNLPLADHDLSWA